MNGTSYGTSNSGKPCSSAASRSASGIVLVREAGAEPEPGQPVAGEPRDVLALRLGPFELQAGGQQQLAAGQPRRRVDELGDVHPADGSCPRPPRPRRGGPRGRGGGRGGRAPFRYRTSRVIRRFVQPNCGRESAQSLRSRDARPRPYRLRPAAAAPPWPRLVQGDVAARDAVARARPRRDRRRPAGLRRVGARRRDRRRAWPTARRGSPRSSASSAPHVAGQLDGRRHRARARRDGAGCASACAISPDRLLGNDRERAYARAVLIATRLLVGVRSHRSPRAMTSNGALRGPRTFSHVAARPWRAARQRTPPCGSAAAPTDRGSGRCCAARRSGTSSRPSCPTTVAWGERDRLLHLLAPGPAGAALAAGRAPRDPGAAAGTCRRGTTLSRSPP